MLPIVILPPLGMFDLDADGTILYYHAELGSLRNGWADLAERSFYNVAAAFDDAGELCRRVEAFLRGDGRPATSFDFTCRAGGEALTVQALIARVREGSDLGRTKVVVILRKGAR